MSGGADGDRPPRRVRLGVGRQCARSPRCWASARRRRHASGCARPRSTTVPGPRVSSAERQRVKELEREVRELRPVNEILPKAARRRISLSVRSSAFSRPGRSSSRRSSSVSPDPRHVVGHGGRPRPSSSAWSSTTPGCGTSHRGFPSLAQPELDVHKAGQAQQMTRHCGPFRRRLLPGWCV